MGMTWKLVKNDIPAIIAAMNPRVTQTLQQVADQITQDVKNAAPVDTGALRDGYYNTMTSATTAEVRSGDDILYSAFVEEGHHTRSGSWVPAQPHFVPAFDKAAGENLLTITAKNNNLFGP